MLVRHDRRKITFDRVPTCSSSAVFYPDNIRNPITSQSGVERRLHVEGLIVSSTTFKFSPGVVMAPNEISIALTVRPTLPPGRESVIQEGKNWV